MSQKSDLLSDIEDLRVLKHHLPKHTQSFILSMLDYFGRKGYVSQGQAPYVAKYAAECRLAEANKQAGSSDRTEEIFDGSQIRSAFNRAARISKFPRVKLPSADIPGGQITFHIAGQRSRTPGWIVCSNGRKLPEYFVYATVDLAGEGQINRNIPSGIKTLIRQFAAKPGEVAGRKGRESGSCCFCGLGLTHPNSLHHGYGPICAEKFGLPWEGPSKEAAAAEVELYPLDDLDKIGLEDL